MPIDERTRQAFINDWAKLLKVEAKPHVIAAELIRKHKNYQTACFLVFGLSVHEHKEYTVAAAKHMQEAIEAAPKGTVVTGEWLNQFVQYYVTEVVPYPEGA